MNNIFFSSLLCITVLTFAPACNKKKAKPTSSDFAKTSDFAKASSDASSDKQEIKTTIELDNTIIEIEEDTIDQNTSKF